jgi:hypothetical protein
MEEKDPYKCRSRVSKKAVQQIDSDSREPLIVSSKSDLTVLYCTGSIGGEIHMKLEKSDPFGDQARSTRDPAVHGGGPRSAAGKAKSSKNSIRHGINSLDPVAAGESLEDWLEFHKGMERCLSPVGTLEIELVFILALLLWRRRRIIAAEVGSIDLQHEKRWRPAEWWGLSLQSSATISQRA